MRLTGFAAFAVFFMALLAGCGGGGGGVDDPPALVAPTITQQPASARVPVGASVSFSVAASGQTLAYQWLRGAQDIPGAISSTYALANVQAGDSGSMFSVKVSNAGGLVTSTAAVLTVEVPVLSVVTQPSDVSVRVGGSASFSVAVSGPSSPAFQWLADGNAIPGATSSTYTLAAAQLSHDQRAFSVVVTAASQSVTSRAALLTVRPLPLLSLLAGNLGDLTGSSSTAFAGFSALAADTAGNVYVADRWAVRKISPAGEVTTLAGDPVSWGYADGMGAVARFGNIAALAVDASGHLLVADGDNFVIRKISPEGVVTTLAGAPGTRAYIDGPSAAARFLYPTGLAVDAAGNVYVADGAYGANYVRKISPAGVVSTVAGGTFTNVGRGSQLAVDRSGIIYMTATEESFRFCIGICVYGIDAAYIRKLTPEGVASVLSGSASEVGNVDGPAASARFGLPAALAFDAAGNLLVADADNHKVRRIDASGAASTVLGTGTAGVVLGAIPGGLQWPGAVATLPGGRFYVSSGKPFGAPGNRLGFVVLKAEGL